MFTMFLDIFQKSLYWYKNDFFVRAEVKLIGVLVNRCYGRDRKTNKNGYKWSHAQCFLSHGHLAILDTII